ncbi:MAG: outer membrane protein assembly factor BamA [Planctomycetes bacterium]|nr:outer membrane protein assembly factor BamA [Planctomycetota bacterium]
MSTSSGWLLLTLAWGMRLALGAPAPAPLRITDIRFQGLERLSEAQVLAKMKARTGDLFDRDRLEEDVRRLYESGEFEEIVGPRTEPYAGGVRVVFTFREKSRVQHIAFAGRRKIREKTLLEDLHTREGGLVTPYWLNQDAEKIRDKYRKKGFLFVDVAGRSRPVAGGLEVTFVIDEGPRVRIRDIEFLGNRSISSGKLRGLMATRRKDWFFGIFQSGYYDQEVLERDIDRLRNYYRYRGFLDALVWVDDTAFRDQKARLRIRIRVEEGDRYRLAGVRFSGNRVFSDAQLSESLRISKRIGQPYEGEETDKEQNQIVRLYQEKAYLDARVLPELVIPELGREVTLVYKIEENNKIYADRVEIIGNEKTKDKVIRRELAIIPGEEVTGQKLRETYSRLHRLQFFSPEDDDLKIDWRPGPEPGRSVFEVNVQEVPTGRLLFGFGVQGGAGLFGTISLRKRNFDITDWPDSVADIPGSFTGAGQTVDLELQPGTRYSRYRLAWTEPWLFDTQNALRLEGIRYDFSRGDYDEDRWGFRSRLTHYFDLDRDFATFLGYRFDLVDISHVELDAAADVLRAGGYDPYWEWGDANADGIDQWELRGRKVGGAETRVSAGSIGVELERTLFDPFDGNYDGYRASHRWELGGGFLGAEVDFWKAEADFEIYRTVYETEEMLRHIISLAGHFGYIEGFSRTEAPPIFERFWLGGPTSMRGFRWLQMGPHDRVLIGPQADPRVAISNDEVFGTTMLYFNAEYTFPLFIKYLRGVAFCDAGILDGVSWRYDAGPPPRIHEDWGFRMAMDRFRVTLGVGVRVNLYFLGQAIPIGLYWGRAVRSQDEDRTQEFLFHLGYF